jgi:protein TonB
MNTTGNLKWCIALSVALHAVVLVPALQEDTDAGNPGHVINLDMVETAGDITAAPIGSVADRTPKPAATTPNTPARTAETATAAPAREPEQTGAGNTGTIDSVATSTPTDSPGPPAAVAASNPEQSRQEADRHLRNSILELVASNLKYPPLARRKGWQGIVVLELRIEADGRISRLHVNATSGYPVLDRAAVEALQLASVTQAGQWLDGEAVDIVVPVEYRLVDTRS